eukprot:3938558-Rhodomonas_salina.3
MIWISVLSESAYAHRTRIPTTSMSTASTALSTIKIRGPGIMIPACRGSPGCQCVPVVGGPGSGDLGRRRRLGLWFQVGP